MKKLLLILSVYIVSFAQEPMKKWVIVQDLQDRIVYLDTSAIKPYENQISLWGLTRYRESQRLNPFNTLVKQVKSNFLINTVTKTYSVIGTLYYDRTGKIVGESSAPRITGGEDTFELPVQPGSSVEVLYEKAVNYLVNGSLTAEPSEFTPPSAEKWELGYSDTSGTGVEETSSDTAQMDTGPVRLTPEENIAFVDEYGKQYLEEQKRVADSIETDSALDQMENETELDESKVQKINPPQNKADLSGLKLDKPKKKNSGKPKYDESKDQNIRSNIWSDGNLYVIQLSSWRRKDVAEEQTAKHKSAGHNAYIMEANLPGKGTWYRVRIGYFNTLEEAQNYKRTNNL